MAGDAPAGFADDKGISRRFEARLVLQLGSARADVGERQMLEIRQPDLERLDSKLKDTFLDADVTTKKVVEKLGLNYFTSFHIIKEMERRGELEIAEFEVGPLWRWKEA